MDWARQGASVCKRGSRIPFSEEPSVSLPRYQGTHLGRSGTCNGIPSWASRVARNRDRLAIITNESRGIVAGCNIIEPFRVIVTRQELIDAAVQET